MERGIKMKRNVSPLIWGIVLVVVGLLILMQNLGYLENLLPSAWAVAFGLGGLAFLALFIAHREQWWAIIPAMTLLGLGLLVGVEELGLLPGFDWGGPLFLGMLSLAFWIVYAARPAFWWAIIPGGVLASVAGIAALDQVASGDHAWFLFLGMAATFGLVAVLRGGRSRRWALIPAAVMLVMSLVLMSSATGLLGYAVPALLVVGGAYFIFRGFLAQKPD
jgi:hypothetical protein